MNNVSSDNQSSGLQTRLYIDRDIAAYLGITMSDINNVLYDAFGQRQISTLYTQFNQYFVIMEILPVLQGTLDHLYLKNTAGDPIPLSLMIKTQQETVPLAFTRQNQFPVSTISFNLNEGYSLSQALEAIEMIRHTLEVPSSVEVTLEGLSSIFKKSLSHQLWLCLAAVVVVYLVLGMLYESYIHPLIILSTLPPATFGALLTLFLTKTELSIVALIGIILLIGIVMKNAIIMIDFALTLERQEAKTPQDAIYEACLLRFRPIIMTTATALLGSIPLLFNGVGCELRQPLGLVIIGGLIVSQVLTLYTIPAIYLFFNKLSKITISAQSSVAV
jgi:multidrug efflux pump